MGYSNAEKCANCSNLPQALSGISYSGIIRTNLRTPTTKSLPLCADCVAKVPESLRLPIVGTEIPPDVVIIVKENRPTPLMWFSQTLYGVRRNTVKFCLGAFANQLWPGQSRRVLKPTSNRCFYLLGVFFNKKIILSPWPPPSPLPCPTGLAKYFPGLNFLHIWPDFPPLSQASRP